ncbi:MAG TPA: carboxypeptidase regulatory-like domain-containing protein [Cellulomonas sp.]|uniref:carboxypeptidase regulatory-like domain-containing protein n=1 Tax=Cellulomonas sp. TaxID=40001 RepID=UPI002E32FE77|nr:carboxypeptidase regulatory-like domain-containing protein [Cellulomonas sp.]HEX5333267.1 carboxypeptidase regulatory-like domain-containing protein [Cellulomonas sp.]
MSPDELTLARLASSPLDGVDAETLNRLAAIIERVDPVPAGLVESIGLALTIDALETEVAELRLIGAPDLALRSEEPSIEAATITFTTDVLTVMITVHAEADRVRVDGWATPAASLGVELHQGGLVTRTQSDADGRFSFSDLGRGPARLVLRRPEDPELPVVTPQIEL